MMITEIGTLRNGKHKIESGLLKSSGRLRVCEKNTGQRNDSFRISEEKKMPVEPISPYARKRSIARWTGTSYGESTNIGRRKTEDAI